MKQSMYTKLLLILGIFAATIGYAYCSYEINQTVIIRDVVNQDLYAAGQSVQVAATVHGDVTAAAQRISIEDTVDGDVNAAAEVITITAPITDDVRAAGRLLTFTASIGDHIVAAGESISIGTKASTQGWAKLAGRQVEVLGNIGGDLGTAAQHVIIGGIIEGNAEITADTIVILSSANIKGKLIYRSPNKPDIRSGAQIEGGIEQLPMPDTEHVSAVAVKAISGILLVFGLSLMLTAIVYLLIFPQFSLGCARTISDQPLQTLGLGVAVVIIVPFIILLLLVTVIGYILALCLLAAYSILLLLGLLTGMIYFSDLVLRRIFKRAQASKGVRALTLIATSIILAILIIIPIVGALLLLFLIISGIGALHLQLWDRYTAAQQ